MDDALLLDHLGASRRFEHIELRRTTGDRVRALGRVETADTYGASPPHASVDDGLIGEPIFSDDRFGCIDLPEPIEHPFARGWLLDFVLVLPVAFRRVERSGDAISMDSTTALYVKVVARRNRLRHFLADPPSAEDGGDEILANERATLAKWIAVLFHNTRGVSEDFSPDARVGLLDRLGSSNAAIADELFAFDQAVGSKRDSTPAFREMRAILACLGFEILGSNAKR